MLHGDATAAFRVPSLGEGALLAEAVTHVPGLKGSGALLTIADDRLSVRLRLGVQKAALRNPVHSWTGRWPRTASGRCRSPSTG